MSSFRKYIALPEENLRALQNENSEKINKETVARILQIALHLARINGYNSYFQIKGRDGQYLTNTNVIGLIEKIETDDPQLPGEEEFIYLLHDANVPLDLIRNERIKTRLSKLQIPIESFSTSFERVNTSTPTTKAAIAPIPAAEKVFKESKKYNYHNFFIAKKKRKKDKKKEVKWTTT